MKGCDFAWGVIPGRERDLARALKAAGFGFVVRYLSHDPSKNLTRAEVGAYRAEGLRIVTVWEDAAAAALGGAQQGTADARGARALLEALGAPQHAPVFFAADFPVTPDQMPAVDAYLDATAFVLSEDENGIYGSYAVTSQARHVRYKWQTAAWSSGAWAPSDQMRQYAQGGITQGVQWDLDVSLVRDFGAWEWAPEPGKDPVAARVPKVRKHRIRKAAHKARHAAAAGGHAVKKEPVLTAGSLNAAVAALVAFWLPYLGIHATHAQKMAAIAIAAAVASLGAAVLSRPVRVSGLTGAVATIATSATTFGLHLPLAYIGGTVPFASVVLALLLRGHVSPVAKPVVPPALAVSVAAPAPAVTEAIAGALGIPAAG